MANLCLNLGKLKSQVLKDITKDFKIQINLRIFLVSFDTLSMLSVNLKLKNLRLVCEPENGKKYQVRRIFI